MEEKAPMNLRVNVDSSELEEVRKKVEKLGALLEEANAQLRELNALASNGIRLEVKL